MNLMFHYHNLEECTQVLTHPQLAAAPAALRERVRQTAKQYGVGL
jgi:hypothetical protein